MSMLDSDTRAIERPAVMSPTPVTRTAQATLRTIAVFPKHYFLENLAARADGSLLVTASTQKELWYVPRPTEDRCAEPMLVHTFEHVPMGIAEIAPDVFFVSVSDLSPPHRCYLMRLDLNGWTPGAALTPEVAAKLDDRARSLNGSCFLAPDVLLLADSLAGLIWRVDLPANGRESQSRVWVEHSNMMPDRHTAMKPVQPGVNGIRFAGRSHDIYYTSTAQKLFLRVPVHPTTLDAGGEPELVASGMMGDDFCIDEDAGTAYVATHRQNTIDRVPLARQKSGATQEIVAGDPFCQELIGPSSGVWGRQPGDDGRRAYFTSDGGAVAAPPDGRIRIAKVLEVKLAATPPP